MVTMPNLPPTPPDQAINAGDGSDRKRLSRKRSRPTFLDVALVIAVTVALGITVALLLTDVLAGIAVALCTTVVFRFVLHAINS